MSKWPAFKIFGMSFGVGILASSALAAAPGDNQFVSSIASTETIIVAYREKPPYRNRGQVRARLKAQQVARTKGLEKTELSAMEISEKDDKSPFSGKNTRKRYGHPYHR